MRESRGCLLCCWGIEPGRAVRVLPLLICPLLVIGALLMEGTLCCLLFVNAMLISFTCCLRWVVVAGQCPWPGYCCTTRLNFVLWSLLKAWSFVKDRKMINKKEIARRTVPRRAKGPNAAVNAARDKTCGKQIRHTPGTVES